MADLIIERYTSEKGVIFEKVDVGDGKITDTGGAVDELGDYIQYIIYLGILTSTKHYVDWAIKTISLISRNYQSEKGLYYNRQTSNLLKKNLLSIVDSLYPFEQINGLERVRAIGIGADLFGKFGGCGRTADKHFDVFPESVFL